MKPTQLTELFANVKSSFVSFFAILMFVALGVGVFTGLYWSAPALKQATNTVFNDQGLYDFSVTFPYGFTDENADEVLALDGVDGVALSRESYETYTTDDDRYEIKLQTLTDSINEPVVIEGELPTESNEIALKFDVAHKLGLTVGDTITFDSNGAGDDDGMGNLNEGSFTVTALVENPEYLARDTSSWGISPSKGVALDGVAWVVDEAFDAKAFNDAHPTLYVVSDSLKGLDSYSDAYAERANEIQDEIAALGHDLSKERFDEVKEQAQSQIDEGRAALSDGWQQLNAGQAQLNAMSASSGLGFNAATSQRAELEANRAALTQQEQELNQSEENLAAMSYHDWSISSRDDNGGVAMVSTTSTMTDRLSFSMASLFLIVGLLVTYSTVSRLAHEQIVQIGTKKALGLRGREITMSFLLYATLAVLAGVVVGIVAAVLLVEGILINAISARFIIGPYAPYLGVGLMLLAAVVELALVLFAAWFACRKILREQAVELLKGEKPPVGKTRFYERWGIWNRLPLYTQTIINNCINDKRRMVSTIIGVAGVTALVVTAITLNDDIQNSFNRQYGEVYDYDTVVTFDPDEQDAQSSIDQILTNDGLDPVAVHRRTMPLELPDGGMNTAQVIVPSSMEDFSSVYTLTPIESSDAVKNLPSQSLDELLSLEGVWVSQSLHDNEGAQVGDELTLIGADGGEHELTILGFFEYYLPHFEVVMSEASYEKVFGETAKPDAFFVQLDGEREVSDLRAQLSDVGGFERIIAEKDQQHGLYSSLTSVTYTVVLIYLALSTLMAIVVLLNLNVMFIEEKRRELIVLMINGFSARDAKRYVRNDTILLTIIGIIIGLILGSVLGGVSVLSIESSTLYFYSGIDWIAILVGVVVSAVLAAIMSGIALRRIPRFNLTDINKL